MGLPDLTLQAIGFRIAALLILAGVQGATLAAAAVALGDRGPGYDGRLTLAPTAHLDLAGSFGMVLFGLGWIRWMAVDAGDLRMGRGGLLLVILAGFASLLAMAALLDALVVTALTTLPHTAGLTVSAFLRSASSLSIWMALLSLLPVPPLAGGLLPGAFGLGASPRARLVLTALVFLAVAGGVIRQILAPAHAVLMALVIGG